MNERITSQMSITGVVIPAKLNARGPPELFSALGREIPNLPFAFRLFPEEYTPERHVKVSETETCPSRGKLMYHVRDIVGNESKSYHITRSYQMEGPNLVQVFPKWSCGFNPQLG